MTYHVILAIYLQDRIFEVAYYDSKYDRAIGESIFFDGRMWTVSFLGCSKEHAMSIVNKAISDQNKPSSGLDQYKNNWKVIKNIITK